MTTRISNIVNKELNSCLGDDVFKQLAESDIKSISEESKNHLKTYYNNSKSKHKYNTIDNLKELWKSLLIDSICILKINDKREKLYCDFQNNYGNFLTYFNSIRKVNTYGIDEIAKYFDDYVEFESVLYGTDRHYRDHIEHVLQVWAVGIGLIYHNNIKLTDGYTLDDKSEFNFNIQKDEPHLYISNSELLSMWTVIALCHDLGYPIEKTSRINKQAKIIISHFGNMNFSELNYSFDIFNTFLVDKYLNIISSKANIENSSTSIQTKFRDKLSKSLEDYQHGIFSGLLLFKNLTYFLETDLNQGIEKLSKEDLRQFYIRKEILRAISGHTCPKIYHLSLNTLSFLLILCDEVQEWKRPKFDVLRGQTNNIEPKVEIKEFEMSDSQRIKIQFNYENPIEEGDIVYLVKNRYVNIHHLLRSAKSDSDRKIYFQWDIIINKGIYTFIFDSSLNSFQQLKISKKVVVDGVEKEEPYNIY